MRVYTFSEARQNFASVLDLVEVEGCVQVTRRDGGSFKILPMDKPLSPLDVKGLDSDISAEEIVSAIRESRNRGIDS